MSTQILSNKLTRLNAILAMVFTTLFAVQAHAMFGFEPYYKFGAVYTRSIVVDPSTNMPIWVEYDETGREANVIGGMQDGDFTFSGTEYRAYHDQYTQIMETMPDAIWMSVYDYLAQPEYLAYNDETFAPVEINPDYDNVQFVLVRSKEQTQIADGEHHLLARFPVDIRQPVGGDYASLLLRTDPASGAVSAIITPAEPDYNIGFRVKFFGPEGDDTGEEALDGVDANTYRKATDVIYGPIKGARITTTPAARISDGAETGEDGKYSMHYTLPPCPGFTFSYTTPAYLELQYNRFNPRLPGYRIYWQQRIDYDFCNGLAATAPAAIAPTIIGILASAATPIKRPRDFPIDIMVINGHARLENPDGSGVDVTPELGDIQSVFALDNFSKSATAPAYDLSVPSFVRQTQSYYDFDKDGEYETTVLGRVVEVPVEGGEEGETEKLFFPQDDQDYPCVTSRGQSGELCSHQGVYLSSTGNLPAESQPDILRIADWGLDDNSEFQDKGLATEMGEIDLSNTDLYIFRESNGELIAERRGLNTAETNASTKGLQGAAEGRFFYTLEMRGPREGIYSASYLRRNPVDPATGNPVGPQNAYRFWQQQSGVVEKFWNREADHLRPGERIRIIAINRVTGYMGSVTTELKAHSNTDTDDNGDTIERNAMMIDYSVNDIVMRPPNLKVWAERSYTVEQGLTRGTQYLGDDARDPTDDSQKAAPVIGFEGAGLGTDTAIVVYTEWLDQDGRALPEALGDYGYTARFAKIVAPNQLDDAAVGQADDGSGAVAQFPIKPGKHTSVIRFSNPNSNREHLYIHVSGQPYTRQADFEQLQVFQSTDTSTGMQESRPDRYVPIKVPVYNEDQSLQAQKTYRDYVEAQGEDADITTPKPEPIYEWLYRPEFQFSVYDLTEQEIRRQVSEDDVEDIYTAETPVIASSDELITFAYNLLSRDINGDGLDNDTLNAFSYDGDRELVIALGEEELFATIGSNQTITFDNLEALASLDAEDFLSMRLYSNNDAANILWEWAFYSLALIPSRNSALTEENNTITVSADIAAEGQQSVNAYLNKSNNEIQRVDWQIIGDGQITPESSFSSNGIYNALINLPLVSDSVTTVSAKLRGSESAAYSTTYKIVSGEPASIEVTEKNGTTVIGGLGEITWTLKIEDAHGNSVADGTKILVLAPELKIESTYLTVDGEVEVKFIGDSLAGEQNVIIAAGNASLLDVISVYDVSLSFSNLTDIDVGENKSLVIQATSDYGSLQGLELDVAVHRGTINTSRVALNASGNATVLYYGGNYRGFAQISTKVSGTKTFLTESFSVVEADEDYLESNVLVTNGTGSIDLENGGTLNYSNSTNLHVTASPGESVSSSLENIFKPPVYALLDYTTELGVVGDGVIFDISSGIDASFSNVALVQSDLKTFNLQWEISSAAGQSANIEIPDHARLSSLTEAGLNFWIKMPELDEINADTNLVDWDDYGLRIRINADKTLSLLALNANGEQELKHSLELQAGEWHQVAAHLLNNELKLGVDGQVATAAIASPVIPANAQSYSVQLGVEGGSQQTISITDLKLYDWNGEAKLTFSGGSFASNTVADQDGKAQFAITAQPATFAYTRHYEEKTMIASMRDIVLPSAYALDVTACQNSYEPIAFDDEDAVIKRADQYMTMLLECFIKPHVEEAQIEYETVSGGLKEKAVALVKREMMEAVYAVLKQQKNNSVAVLNCLDASLTGSNSSAVGAACDFVTSMLAVGDIRDILLQSWHYHLGELTGTSEDYDELTAQLSAIGLVASASQLIPAAGQTAGVVATAFVATAKTVAKFFKRVGNVGKQAGRVVATKLGKIMDNPATDTAQKIEEVRLLSPLMEVGLSLTLVYNEEPRLFSFLVNVIRSGKALDNFVGWLGRYIERLENELIADQASGMPEWLGDLIPTAYAISDGAKSRFIVQLRKLLDDIELMPDDYPMPKFADNFNESLEEFLEKVVDQNYPFSDVPNDMDVIRAFMKVNEMGGKDAVRAFGTRVNYTIGFTADVFDDVAFVKAFGEMDLAKLLRNAPGSDAQLATLIKKFSNGQQFNFAKGYVAHALVIIDALKRSDIKIVGVEVVDDVVETAAGILYAGRRIDLVVEVNVGGVVKQIKIEIKNFQSSTWKDNLTAMMAGKASKAADQTESVDVITGQLRADLLKYMEAGNQGRQIYFTPDIIADASKRQDPAAIAQMEDEVISHIQDLVEKNDEFFAKARGYNLEDAEQLVGWGREKENLFNALMGGGPDQRKFVEIYRYENILPSQN